MKESILEFMGRHVPVAVVMALLVQGGTAVWWVAAKDRDSVFLEKRVSQLEDGILHVTSDRNGINERLARIEERLAAQSGALERIESVISNQ